MEPVQLLEAHAGSAPTGTGSFSYFTNASVVVANLGFEKVVGVWGHDQSTGTWQFHPCSFDRSVPGNVEVWTAQIFETQIDIFDIEYKVLGTILWDNNSGFDYRLDTGAAHTDGVGTVALGADVRVAEWGLTGSTLAVDVIARNLAVLKQVGVVWTTDGWSTFQNAFGTFTESYPPASAPHQPSAELWTVKAPVGTGAHGQFAAFSIQNNNVTSWDNNFGLNYSF
jgi:hypothetical protein